MNKVELKVVCLGPTRAAAASNQVGFRRRGKRRFDADVHSAVFGSNGSPHSASGTLCVGTGTVSTIQIK